MYFIPDSVWWTADVCTCKKNIAPHANKTQVSETIEGFQVQVNWRYYRARPSLSQKKQKVSTNGMAIYHATITRAPLQ